MSTHQIVDIIMVIIVNFQTSPEEESMSSVTECCSVDFACTLQFSKEC